MADVIIPMAHHRHTSSIGSMTAGSVDGRAPVIEIVPNPDFSFPRRSPPPDTLTANTTADFSRRPKSMQFQPPTTPTTNLHKRAASTLPSFTFNAADVSGLRDSSTPPITPTDAAPTTPSRRGHKRGGSEFVGGMGVTNALSSSPTKTSALPLPVPHLAGPPSGRRGHAHRRSQAMSSHDVSSIMQTSESEPFLSTSLPNTPLEHPSQRVLPAPLDRSTSAPDIHEAERKRISLDREAEAAALRPHSRQLVAFKNEVEIIPRSRPLSTISSETEGSMSTVRGHSVNNSISSVLTWSSPSTPASRTPPKPSPRPLIDEARNAKPRSSLEVRRPEDDWISRRRSQSPGLTRPLSESAAGSPSLSTSASEPPATPRVAHKKKLSISHALGFDRRRSEPLMGAVGADEPSRLSAISLQSSTPSGTSTSDVGDRTEHKSSARKITSWARAKLSRKSREFNKPLSMGNREAAPEPSTQQEDVPGKILVAGSATPEMDLDAVFNTQSSAVAPQSGMSNTQPRIEVTPTSPRHSRLIEDDDEDQSLMLDLDAAMGPMKTPPMSRRKRLHSDDKAETFTGPGLHYHRRAESVPNMPSFSFNRNSVPANVDMPDVFEEEEPPEEPQLKVPRPASMTSAHSEEAGTGISIVESDTSTPAPTVRNATPEGLGIHRDWEPERPLSAYSNSPRLSSFTSERHGSSVIEDTILEEPSSTEGGLEIVQDHEEPRASSLTKSSDSSETPTLLAQPGMLPLPDAEQSLMTPDTYQTSTFSTPELGRRQSSFDTSRIGTAASSITDNHTSSSCMTGDGAHSVRISMDDVPSLTSSRSTMMSSMQANTSRRDVSSTRTPSGASATLEPPSGADTRRKRASIHSLSQLVGGSFNSKPKVEASRPQTAGEGVLAKAQKQKKEHRLKKLMFWKSKQVKRSASTADL